MYAALPEIGLRRSSSWIAHDRAGTQSRPTERYHRRVGGKAISQPIDPMPVKNEANLTGL